MRFITSIEEALKNIFLPIVNQNVVNSGWLQEVQNSQNGFIIKLKFGFPLDEVLKSLFKETIEKKLQSLQLGPITLLMEWQIRAHAVQSGLSPLPGVKNVIAVASGKGGVGKSTTAVNLALSLSNLGARVGLLDADIYGPNQPLMLGAKGRPEILEDKTIMPLMAHGLQTMSIGYLVNEATPMVWRGPMISAALNQLVHDTRWDNLDYLVVDLPPGTGDIQLTLAKKVPVTGVIMVTTPQDVALLDVRKGLEMFRKVDVNILGVVENMSGHRCSQCGHQEALFGEGGGQRLAALANVPLLGQLPLSLNIREDSDRGHPTVAADPNHEISKRYREIAIGIAAQIALLKINYQSKFPKIVVE